MRFLFLILFSTILILPITFFFRTVFAESPYTIIFNEILPDPSGADLGKEWIELYNYSDNQINIGNWKIKVTSSIGSVREITLPVNIFIASKSYYILVESADSYPGENKVVLGSGKINLFNSASTIALIDSSGNIIDTSFYDNVAEGKFLERNGPDSTCNKWLAVIQSSINKQNSNYSPQCFGEGSPTSYPTNHWVKFSTDGINWFDKLEAKAPTQVYFKSDLPIKNIIYQQQNLDNPANIDLEINSQIKVVLNNNEEILTNNLRIFPQLKLNEIYYSSKEKWVELFANRDSSLTDFKLFYNNKVIDFTKKASQPYTDLDCSNKQILKNSEFCLLGLDSITTLQDIKLQSKNGFVLDSLNYENEDHLSLINGTWSESTITPAKDNAAQLPNVIISEAYSSPDSKSGENEWIEIRSLENYQINLNGWYLSDLDSTTGGPSSKKSSLGEVNLAANAYYLINKPSISLNNDGDSIFLFDSYGQLIDRFDYQEMDAGQSFIKNSKSELSVLTSKPTPGEPNFQEEIVTTGSTKSVETKSASKTSTSKTASSSVKGFSINFHSLPSTQIYDLPYEVIVLKDDKYLMFSGALSCIVILIFLSFSSVREGIIGLFQYVINAYNQIHIRLNGNIATLKNNPVEIDNKKLPF